TLWGNRTIERQFLRLEEIDLDVDDEDVAAGRCHLTEVGQQTLPRDVVERAVLIFRDRTEFEQFASAAVLHVAEDRVLDAVSPFGVKPETAERPRARHAGKVIPGDR